MATPSPASDHTSYKVKSRIARYRADTRLKVSMSVNGTLSRNLTEHVTAAVRNDLQENTYLVKRKDFLQTFFPPDDDAVRKTYGALLADKTYANGRWTQLPEAPGKQESLYYEPFTLILNRIHQEYEKNKKADNNNFVKSRRVWLDRHSKKPTSVTRAAANRPDIVNLFVDETQLEAFSEALELSIKAFEVPQQTEDIAGEPSPTTNNTLEASEHVDNILAYWLRTATVVEIKTKKSDKNFQKYYEDTLEQLAGYMRQMFREQHDRMFVFGLILFHDSLSVWYCDRSGLLGMEDFIDINKEPELFIRVIARLSTMNPRDLGWDPTMKVYSNDGQHAYSHSLEFDDVLKNFARSTYLYRTRWEINVKGEEYVTIRALSLSRAEVMCGRGQLVWLAVNKKTRKVVVIKQSWSPFPSIDGSNPENKEVTEEQDSVIRSEASIYQHAQAEQNTKIGHLVAHEELDNTRTLRDFRKGIQHDFQQIPNQFTTSNPKHGDIKEESLHISAVQWFKKKFSNPLPLTERQLSRLVLDDYGYPLKRFRSLHELMQIADHCLEGYQFLLQKGIVHRDISPGNCLICLETKPTPAESIKKRTESFVTTGRLIDLDHAKIDKGYDFEKAVVEARNRVSDKDGIENLNAMIRMSGSVVVNADVLKSVHVLPIPIMEQHPWTALKAATYVETIGQSLGLVKGTTQRELTLEDLRLPHWQTPYPPRFQHRVSELSERTGTMPYMSHSLLNSSPDVTHTSVHDMESLFWVLLYLCLTRSGPGGDLRTELVEQPGKVDETTEDLHRIIYCFYDGPREIIKDNKNDLFTTPKDLEEYIFKHIHPYFLKLKPVLLEWWRILSLGFQQYNNGFEPIEYVHTSAIFRLAILKWLEGHPDEVESEEPYTRMTKQEDRRREKDRKNILNAIVEICGPDTNEDAAEIDVDIDRNTGVPLPPLFDSPQRKILTTKGSYKGGRR